MSMANSTFDWAWLLFVLCLPISDGLQVPRKDINSISPSYRSSSWASPGYDIVYLELSDDLTQQSEQEREKQYTQNSVRWGSLTHFPFPTTTVSISIWSGALQNDVCNPESHKAIQYNTMVMETHCGPAEVSAPWESKHFAVQTGHIKQVENMALTFSNRISYSKQAHRMTVY